MVRFTLLLLSFCIAETAGEFRFVLKHSNYMYRLEGTDSFADWAYCDLDAPLLFYKGSY